MSKAIIAMLLVLFPTFALGVGSTPTPQTAQQAVTANGAIIVHGYPGSDNPSNAVRIEGNGRYSVCTEVGKTKTWPNSDYKCTGQWVSPKQLIAMKYPMAVFAGIAVSSLYVVIYYQVPE